MDRRAALRSTRMPVEIDVLEVDRAGMPGPVRILDQTPDVSRRRLPIHDQGRLQLVVQGVGSVSRKLPPLARLKQTFADTISKEIHSKIRGRVYEASANSFNHDPFAKICFEAVSATIEYLGGPIQFARLVAAIIRDRDVKTETKSDLMRSLLYVQIQLDAEERRARAAALDNLSTRQLEESVNFIIERSRKPKPPRRPKAAR